MRAAVRVLGLGNPLMGDDGVGIRVVEQMAAAGLPPGVEVVDGGTGGLALLDEMDGAGGVVLVDAGSFGAAPGTVCRVEGDDLARPPGGRGPLSSHLDPGFVLAVGRGFGRLPPVVAYLVQVGSVAPGVGLSPPVARAVPGLVRRVATEARALAGGARRASQ